MTPTPPEWWRQLPPINASLNGSAAVLLIAGFVMIKNRQLRAHATLMIAAFVASTVFLACYLTYHAMTRGHVTKFPPGTWRPWYYLLLISHTVLAVVILPLIAGSFWFAWKRQWKRHHAISCITFPLWLYVSVTGVLVYFALYHLAPRLAH